MGQAISKGQAISNRLKTMSKAIFERFKYKGKAISNRLKNQIKRLEIACPLL